MPKTLPELILDAGSSLEAIAGALDIDPVLLVRVIAGRQPLPPQIAPQVAALLGVELGTLRASVPLWAAQERSEMLTPMPADPLLGEPLNFVPLNQALPVEQPAGFPVLPLLLSSLVLWHRGDMVAPTAKVSFWQDLSPGGNSAEQTNEPQQPLRTASHPALGDRQVLSFESGDTLDVFTTEPAGDWTYFAVLDLVSVATLTCSIFTGDLGFSIRSGQVSYFDGAPHDVGAAIAGPQLLTYRMQATVAGTVYRNGTLLGSSTYAVALSPLAGGSSIMSGHVGTTQILAEHLLYNVVLSDEEIAAVTSYLLNRYGLA